MIIHQMRCVKCSTYYYSDGNAHLIEACSSVAMSQGKKPGEVLQAFLKAYHKKGHKEA